MIIISAKTQLDKSSGMIKAWLVQMDTGQKFRVGRSGWTPGTQTMYAFGQFGVDLIKARVARGIGSEDSPMPALSQKKQAIFNNGKLVRLGAGYAARKQARGLQPIRDLTGFGVGGHMLDAFSVRYADEYTATLAITQQLARQKASSNEKRAAWFGWSPGDVMQLQRYGRNVFNAFKAEVLYRSKAPVIPIGPFAAAAAAREQLLAA